jgi:hypothetical protein
MVLHAQDNQGIRIIVGGHIVTVQATREKGMVRYWVGKPDAAEVELVQCRTSTKAALGARYPRVSP